MDNVTINNYNGLQPLIYLSGSIFTMYQFKLNNSYNGTLLDTPAKLSGLGSGIIRLANGATITIVQ
jgi:hypothetical protein